MKSCLGPDENVLTRSCNFSKNCLSKSEIYQTSRFKGGIVKKLNKKAFEPIDQEEKDLMESIERDEWQPVKEINQEKEKAIAAARNTSRKNKRINRRLTQKDYHQIQIKAIEEGIPYQTLISSIIHKYLNGRLQEQRE